MGGSSSTEALPGGVFGEFNLNWADLLGVGKRGGFPLELHTETSGENLRFERVEIDRQRQGEMDRLGDRQTNRDRERWID